MILLLTFLFIVFILIKGYWRNWKKYHTTILYISLCNVFYNMVAKDYLLWEFNPYPLPSHMHAEIVMSFLTLPGVALIYLSRFFDVQTLRQKIVKVLIWTIVTFVVHYPLYLINFVVYDHGYKFWMEFPFYLAMYTMLPLHHKRPLIVYFLSFLIGLFFILYFNVPIGD